MMHVKEKLKVKDFIKISLLRTYDQDYIFTGFHSIGNVSSIGIDF